MDRFLARPHRPQPILGQNRIKELIVGAGGHHGYFLEGKEHAASPGAVPVRETRENAIVVPAAAPETASASIECEPRHKHPINVLPRQGFGMGRGLGHMKTPRSHLMDPAYLTGRPGAGRLVVTKKCDLGGESLAFVKGPEVGLPRQWRIAKNNAGFFDESVSSNGRGDPRGRRS